VVVLITESLLSRRGYEEDMKLFYFILRMKFLEADGDDV
jgi:hypothetical protein